MLTNTGEIASDQMSMYRERVRTIGISLLGGNSGVEGPYELGIDSIRAVNEEDVTVPLSELRPLLCTSLRSFCRRKSPFRWHPVATTARLINFTTMVYVIFYRVNTIHTPVSYVVHSASTKLKYKKQK